MGETEATHGDFVVRCAVVVCMHKLHASPLFPHAASPSRVSSFFRFAPDLGSYVRDAALVISHAGAGSVFEALRAHKPLLVVVNEALMDNHQAELAHALAQEGHLAYCAPQQLLAAFEALRPEQLRPYAPASAAPLARAIDTLCGFTPTR